MNRKSFIAFFLALLFPWRKKAPTLTATLHLDTAKFREKLQAAIVSARRIADSDGEYEVIRARIHAFRSETLRELRKDIRESAWIEINDPARPHHLGYYSREVSA